MLDDEELEADAEDVEAASDAAVVVPALVLVAALEEVVAIVDVVATADEDEDEVGRTGVVVSASSVAVPCVA